jgi:hypothetical protein
MRKLILTTTAVAAAIAGAFADMDSADVDYCIDWGDGKDIFNTRLIFVKKYNDLKTFKIPRNRRVRSACTSYTYSFSTCLYLVDKSGRQVFHFNGGFAGGGGGGFWMKHTTSIAFDSVGNVGKSSCVSSTSPSIISAEELEEHIKIDFADTASLWESVIKNVKKKNVLGLKGKIINGYVEVNVHCRPDLDTTYQVGFRAKVIGECKSDFLKKH